MKIPSVCVLRLLLFTLPLLWPANALTVSCPDELSFRLALEKLTQRAFEFVYVGAPSQRFEVIFTANPLENFGFLDPSLKSYAAVVQTVPNLPSQPTYVLAYAERMAPLNSARVDFGWLLNIDHQLVFSQVKKISEERGNLSLHRSLELLASEYGDHSLKTNKMRIQGRVVFEQMRKHYRLTSLGQWRWPLARRKRDISDLEFAQYFALEKTLPRTPGIAYSILEKLSSGLPLGTDLAFHVAHDSTLAAMQSHRDWQRTALGRLSHRAGFDLSERFSERESFLVITTKIRAPHPFFFLGPL